MPRELCPTCGAIKNMRVSIHQRESVAADGKIKKVVTKTYHCEICASFVRSEDIEETQASSSRE